MNEIRNFDLAERIGIEKRCGFWEVDNLYFFDKLECLRYASRKKIEKINYHFYDSVFGSLNWKKEPEKSLKEMYRERALQLRQKYDYLILCFSGGSDSTNILKTFIDNKIKLDEIYCEYPIEFVEKYNIFESNKIKEKHESLLIYEWMFSAKPVLERLSQTNPEIKITIQSTDFNDAIKRIDNSQLHNNVRNGGIITPSIKYRGLYDCVKNKSNAGCITGLDKPRVVYNLKTNKFYSVYEDFLNISGGSYVSNNNFLVLDHFYYAYDYPELNQKMCFVLKNAILELMNTHKREQLKALIPQDKYLGSKDILLFDNHNDYFKKLLYENWNTKIWQAKKSSSMYYHPTFVWFNSSKVTTEKTKHFFEKQLVELLFNIDNKFIIFNEHGMPDRLITFVTKLYEF